MRYWAMGNFVACGLTRVSRSGRSRHHHRFWELCHYTGGEGFLNIESHRIPFRPGTLVLIPPFHTHEDHSDGNWVNHWFHFREWPGHEQEIRVEARGSEDPFAPLLSLLARESRRRRPCSEEVLDLVLRLLHTRSDVLSTDLVEDLQERLQRALYFPDQTLSTLFSGRPESMSTLTRRFRARVGVGPMAFLIRQRMVEAKRLLEGGLSVGLVARKLGYEDLSYFSRLYRMKMGHAPHEVLDGLRRKS